MTLSMIPRYQQFDALGDPNRLQVFELLAVGPMAVGELAEKLPISRPAVSQHLKLLEQAELVTHVKSGTRNLYRVNAAGVRVLRDHLDLLWGKVMDEFKVAAEAAYQHTKGRKR
jgi:DNA-binding transcriptional ArsR family regulator